ncbi:MAG: hypothetical protein ACRD12_13255 [Acidimicrobiales bacterium]
MNRLTFALLALLLLTVGAAACGSADNGGVIDRPSTTLSAPGRY